MGTIAIEQHLYGQVMRTQKHANKMEYWEINHKSKYQKHKFEGLWGFFADDISHLS